MAFPIIQKYKRMYLCILYLLQAIPQGLIYFSIQDWLTGNGFSIKDIALITAIASVPWSLKFLIANEADILFASLLINFNLHYNILL